MKNKLTIQDIILYEKNAKQHPEWHIKKIAESIKAFGCKQPIVIDKFGVLVAGHGRFLAMRDILKYTRLAQTAHTKKGEPRIPYLVADDLSKDEIRAYRLADNQLNAMTGFDRAMVVGELQLLDEAGYNLEVTGFDRDMLLSDDDKDDIVPDEPKKPVSKVGDIYTLGKHILVCGDSTNPATYKRLMGGVKADMIFTDPPYNVNYSGRGKTTSRKIENDDMTPEQFDAFLNGVFGAMVAEAKDGAGWYVFHSTSTQAQFEQAMAKAGLVVKNQLIWNKPTASMGWGDYRWKHEPFYYASKEGKTTFYGDRTNTTVVDFHDEPEKILAWIKREKRAEAEGKTTIWTMKRDSVQGYVHPTQKPVELILHALVNSSKQGDIILDPFGGSGSTLVACEKSNRSCRTIELDPTFADTIVQRYVDYTGDTNIFRNDKPIEWKQSEKAVKGKGKGKGKKEMVEEKPEHYE